jgi:hypothetical protein
MVEFSPPVAPGHILLTSGLQVGSVSATGEPLTGVGVIYMYATVSWWVVFGATSDFSGISEVMYMPAEQVLRFTVSPLSSYFAVGFAKPTTPGDLFWYLVGESSE